MVITCTFQQLAFYHVYCLFILPVVSDVNKDLDPKAKVKDLSPKAKDLSAKAKAKDLGPKARPRT